MRSHIRRTLAVRRDAPTPIHKEKGRENMKLSFREKLAYGLGTGGEQFPFYMVNVYLYAFFNVIWGIPAMTVGTIFLIARIWDAINDPMMGILADRTRTRWGSYRPWAFFATIPMCIFITLCFAGPDLSSGGKIFFASVVYILFGMSNTASIIPLGSMVNVMTTDYQERAMLGTFREFGSSIGNCLTSIVVPAVITLGVGIGLSEIRSYTLAAFLMGLLAIVVLGFTFFNTKERVQPESGGSFWASFKALKGNVPAFSMIFFYFFLSLFIIGRQMFNFYYAQYYMGNPALTGTLMTVMSVAPFLMMWFVPGITKKFGKKGNMMIGSIVCVVAGLLFAVAQTNVVIAYVAAFVLGLGQNMTYSGVWAALADCADYGEYKNGVHAPGFIFSVAQFGMKLAMSLVSVIVSVVLNAVGFVETAATQTAAAANGIYVFNWASIVVFGVLAALCLIPYNLSQAKMDEVNAALGNR
jgi:GPH family glycoside/pentoside/hexuronide:cation symporter/probable glucitol transport protein GutA